MVKILKPTENPFVQSPSSPPESGISAEPSDRLGDRSSLQGDLPPRIDRFHAHRAEDHRGNVSRTDQQVSKRVRLTPRDDNTATGHPVVRGIRFSRPRIPLPAPVRSACFPDLDDCARCGNGRHTGRAFCGDFLRRKKSFDPALRISNFS